MSALEGEGGSSRDDLQTRHGGERGDDLLGDPVAKVLLILVRTHISKRQNGNRRRHARLDRSRGGARRGRGRVGHASEIAQEFFRRSIPAIWILLQRLVEDDLE